MDFSTSLPIIGYLGVRNTGTGCSKGFPAVGAFREVTGILTGTPSPSLSVLSTTTDGAMLTLNPTGLGY